MLGRLAALELDDDAAELVARLYEVGVLVLHPDAHAGDQLLVGNVGEAGRALELARHRLDQRVFLKGLEHTSAGLLDEGREFFRTVALQADEQRIGHQVGRTFMKLVEIHGHGPMIDRCRAAGRTGGSRTEASTSSWWEP